MRISDWSSDVCSSDLPAKVLDTLLLDIEARADIELGAAESWQSVRFEEADIAAGTPKSVESGSAVGGVAQSLAHNVTLTPVLAGRSEEHTSELQSLMRISYAVFCLKKKKI